MGTKNSTNSCGKGGAPPRTTRTSKTAAPAPAPDTKKLLDFWHDRLNLYGWKIKLAEDTLEGLKKEPGERPGMETRAICVQDRFKKEATIRHLPFHPKLRYRRKNGERVRFTPHPGFTPEMDFERTLVHELLHILLHFLPCGFLWEMHEEQSVHFLSVALVATRHNVEVE